MSLKIVRPELAVAKKPEDAVRLKNRIRGILRQTMAQLMKTEPPKAPGEASRYHAEISDTWADCHVETFDINVEEWVRSGAFLDLVREVIREVVLEEIKAATNG